MQDLEKYISKITPEQILNTLEPYFLNNANLKRFFKETQMIRAYAFISKFKKLSPGIKDVLACYNNALQIRKPDAISIFALTMEIASSKENIFHSAKRPFQNLNDIHDIVLSRFKYIGDSLEISVKYILLEIFALIKLQSGKVDYQQLMNTNFGSAIQFLLDRNILSNILETSPVRIRLSDWRNIAQHNSFIVKDTNIICKYGDNKRFTLALNDLDHYVFQIANSSNMINIARLFFFYDNFDDISKAIIEKGINPPPLKNAIHEDNSDILQLARKHGIIE